MVQQNTNYSAFSSNSSYWKEGVTLPSFPSLNEKIGVDVAIIGGGITGIMSAYVLTRAGIKVALLERGKLAKIDTANTTAHLTYVSDSSLTELTKQFGKEKAGLVWNAGATAIHEIEEIIKKENIECQFSRVPGFMICPIDSDDNSEILKIKTEGQLAKQLGFDVSFEENVEPFSKAGLKFSNQAHFHPYRFLNTMLDLLKKEGVKIYENSGAEKIEKDPIVIRTNTGTVNCDRLIIATHNPIMGVSSLIKSSIFQTKLALYTSYVIGATISKGTIQSACFWDRSDPYYYLRTSPYNATHDYLIFGGKDCKTGQSSNDPAVYHELEKILQDFIPQAEIDHHWSGQVINSPDGLPYIGPNEENQFIATAYSGNGLTFGSIAAHMAKDWILKRDDPWAEMLKPSRKFALREFVDYLKENSDYPYHLVKDYFSTPEKINSEDIRCGEGKVIFLEGRRVAVYRAENGQITNLSPFCTHLGCVVNWNNSEKSWNCPCHGSRFSPIGAVLSGPAETPLRKI